MPSSFIFGPGADTFVRGACEYMLAAWQEIVFRGDTYDVEELLWEPEVRSSQIVSRYNLSVNIHRMVDGVEYFLDLLDPSITGNNPPMQQPVALPPPPEDAPFFEAPPDSIPPLRPFPDDPGSLIRAIRMINLCDHSTVIVRKLLQRLLCLIHPGIIVKWFWLHPNPCFLIRFSILNNTAADLHSVLIVTTPWGTELVVDLTGEQYGYPPKDLISPLEEYKRKYVASQGLFAQVPDAHLWFTYSSILEYSLPENDYWKLAARLLNRAVTVWEKEVAVGLRSVEDLVSEEKKIGMLWALAGTIDREWRR